MSKTYFIVAQVKTTYMLREIDADNPTAALNKWERSNGMSDGHILTDEEFNEFIKDAPHLEPLCEISVIEKKEESESEQES